MRRRFMQSDRRDFHPRPLTIVTHGGDEEPHQPPPLVDLFLAEPFSYEELLDSLDFGGTNGKNGNGYHA